MNGLRHRLIPERQKVFISAKHDQLKANNIVCYNPSFDASSTSGAEGHPTEVAPRKSSTMPAPRHKSLRIEAIRMQRDLGLDNPAYQTDIENYGTISPPVQTKVLSSSF